MRGLKLLQHVVEHAVDGDRLAHGFLNQPVDLAEDLACRDGVDLGVRRAGRHDRRLQDVGGRRPARARVDQVVQALAVQPPRPAADAAGGAGHQGADAAQLTVG